MRTLKMTEKDKLRRVSVKNQQLESRNKVLSGIVHGRVFHCPSLPQAEELSIIWVRERMKIGDDRFCVKYFKNEKGGYTLMEINYKKGDKVENYV